MVLLEQEQQEAGQALAHIGGLRREHPTVGVGGKWIWGK